MKSKSKIILIFILFVLGLSSQVVAQDDPSGDVEVFTWWTGGGEAHGLAGMIEAFSEIHPDINIVNATVAGGSGVNFKAVLVSRMLGGDPPDTFQVHAGQELNALWVAAGRMEPLNDLYEENGWFEQYPQGLIDLISDEEGNVYSVPVNIHRSNLMWYVPANLEAWGVTAPASWEEFVTTTCPTLQEAGIIPISLGQTWTQVHLWESVALGELGVEAYNGLWNGTTEWTSPEVVATFDRLGQIMDCANDDMNALSHQDALLMVTEGRAAFNVMGDWAVSLYTVDEGLEPGVGFAWVPSPGTDGVFMMLSDTFGLPKGGPNPEATRVWLSYLGSAEGQDIFNPLKGSLPANTTADINNPELYNAYFQAAYADWTSNTIVGSLAHGLVAPQSFLDGFYAIMAAFQSGRDSLTASSNAAVLALQTGMGQ
ncbi:MAG: ABC transporter substrate-binding protein [Anaerolineae bacterium]|nr:ABC transporter substrate-binding protein [Anaerolineae bacterium]